MMIDHADGGVRLAELLGAQRVLDDAVDGDGNLLVVEAELLIRVGGGIERVTGLGEDLIDALLVVERGGGEGGLARRVNHAARRDVLRAEVVDGDGAIGVRVKDKLNVVLGLLGRLDEPNRLLADVHEAVEGLGGLSGLWRGIGELQGRKRDVSRRWPWN